MKKFLNLKDVKKYLNVNNNANVAKILVTPQQAKFLLLKCNKVNRRIKADYVKTLRRDMETGNWYDDVDYIGFNSEGMLVNGQHRLKALSEASILSIYLKFDFDVEQHVSMDTGNNRSHSDQVAIFKKLQVDILPNKYKVIILAGLKLTNPRISLSNTELLKIWDHYGDDLKICDENGLFNLSSKAGATVKSSLFWAHLSGVSMDTLSQIAKVLKTGITENDVDIPVIRLRDALVDLRGNSKNLDVKRAQYTQQCIFNVLQGSTTNRLPVNPFMHYQSFDLLKNVEGIKNANGVCTINDINPNINE